MIFMQIYIIFCDTGKKGRQVQKEYATKKEAFPEQTLNRTCQTLVSMGM